MPFRNPFETTCADAFVLATLLCAVAPVNCVTLRGRWLMSSNVRARCLALSWGIACNAGGCKRHFIGPALWALGQLLRTVAKACTALGTKHARTRCRSFELDCGQASLAGRNGVNEGFAARVVSVRVSLRRVRWLVFLPQQASSCRLIQKQ